MTIVTPEAIEAADAALAAALAETERRDPTAVARRRAELDQLRTVRAAQLAEIDQAQARHADSAAALAALAAAHDTSHTVLARAVTGAVEAVAALLAAVEEYDTATAAAHSELVDSGLLAAVHGQPFPDGAASDGGVVLAGRYRSPVNAADVVAIVVARALADQHAKHPVATFAALHERGLRNRRAGRAALDLVEGV